MPGAVVPSAVSISGSAAFGSMRGGAREEERPRVGEHEAPVEEQFFVEAAGGVVAQAGEHDVEAVAVGGSAGALGEVEGQPHGLADSRVPKPTSENPTALRDCSVGTSTASMVTSRTLALRLGNEIVWPAGENEDASSVAVTGSPWSNVNVTPVIDRPFGGTGAWCERHVVDGLLGVGADGQPLPDDVGAADEPARSAGRRRPPSPAGRVGVA